MTQRIIFYQSVDVRKSVESILALIADPAAVDVGLASALAIQGVADPEGSDGTDPIAAAVLATTFR